MAFLIEDSTAIAELAVLQRFYIVPATGADNRHRIQPDKLAANGGEPIISQRESIELYGHTDDVDKTLEEIASQRKMDAFQPTPYE